MLGLCDAYVRQESCCATSVTSQNINLQQIFVKTKINKTKKKFAVEKCICSLSFGTSWLRSGSCCMTTFWGILFTETNLLSGSQSNPCLHVFRLEGKATLCIFVKTLNMYKNRFWLKHACTLVAMAVWTLPTKLFFCLKANQRVT